MVDFDTWTSDYSPFSTTIPFHLNKIIYRSFICVQICEIQIAVSWLGFARFLLHFWWRALLDLWLRLSATFSQICQLQGDISSPEQFLLLLGIKLAGIVPNSLFVPLGCFLNLFTRSSTKEWALGFGINKSKLFSFLITGLGSLQKGLSLNSSPGYFF